MTTPGPDPLSELDESLPERPATLSTIALTLALWALLGGLVIESVSRISDRGPELVEPVAKPMPEAAQTPMVGALLQVVHRPAHAHAHAHESEVAERFTPVALPACHEGVATGCPSSEPREACPHVEVRPGGEATVARKAPREDTRKP